MNAEGNSGKPHPDGIYNGRMLAELAAESSDALLNRFHSILHMDLGLGRDLGYKA